MQWALVVGLISVAGAAGACPGPQDLGAGIVVSFADGTRTTFRAGPDGTVLADESTDAGLPYRTEFARGIWDFAGYDLPPGGGPVNGPMFEWHYPEEPQDLPAPVEGLLWSGWRTPVMGGMLGRSDTLVVVAEAAAPIELSGCRYERLQVVRRAKPATEAPLREHVEYLPELGIGWIGAWAYDGQPVEPVVAVGIGLAP